MSSFNPILEDEEHISKSKIPIQQPTRDAAMSELSKYSNKSRYGSFATLSTETNTWCASSSSDDTDDAKFKILNNFNIDENGSCSAGHSRESSYSDISSDGYYDRLYRHNTRPRRGIACTFIENSLCTIHNFKVLISAILWFICYMFMGLFGGTVAYMHFQRKTGSIPDPLPDFGYDAIPVSLQSYAMRLSTSKIYNLTLIVLFCIANLSIKVLLS